MGSFVVCHSIILSETSGLSDVMPAPKSHTHRHIHQQETSCLTNISVSEWVPCCCDTMALEILVWMNQLGIPMDNCNSIKGYDLQVLWWDFLAGRKSNHQAVFCTRNMSSLDYGTQYWGPQRQFYDHGILSKAQQLLGRHRSHSVTWGKSIFASRLENFKRRALFLKLRGKK